MARRGAGDASSWGGIQSWTWGYYYYPHATTGSSPANGWLMIDHKIVANPIGYTGTFTTNETPFTSNHSGSGANVAMCDGSVQVINYQIDSAIFRLLGSRADGLPASVPN